MLTQRVTGVGRGGRKPRRLTGILNGLCVALSVIGVVEGSMAACIARLPTAQTDEGPHDYSFAVDSPKLWKSGDPGAPLYLRIRVMNTCGVALPGASLQLLHADHDGVHHPQKFRAKVSTNDRGEASIATVFPGFTGGIPRHIHFVVSHQGHRQLVTRLYFKNDPDVEHGIESLAMVVEEIRLANDAGWTAGFEFVLEPK
jgi:protocatechuate 3,4-dioxygenase beta subunit